MDELSEQEIDQFKQRLLLMKEELCDLLHREDDETGPVELDQTSVGRLSRMDALQRQAMAQETERRRHNELLRIEAALKRIEEGEFGYCISTGETIPSARLELDPAVATIVKSQN
ncbi:MAG: TraR/DksA family transcriptional regulator [Hyphomicrobiales bacterium]